MSTDIIYTPSDASALGLHYIDDRRQNKGMGMPIYLPKIDADMNPLLPGDLMTIIGRPGNGKTGFMMRWARSRAQYLRANQPNRLVIYLTLEQSIEQLNAFDLAADTGISVTSMVRGDFSDEDRAIMQQAANKRIGKPLWYIGHSIERRKKRPVINMDTFGAALRSIEEWDNEKYIIDSVFVDYLQRIKLDAKAESKTIALDETLNRLKDGAFAFGCPFIVGVQARREVDKLAVQIPEMDDGQWTSAIEQVSDTSISVTRPRKYRMPGETFGKIIVEGDNQMVVKLLKQKAGPANEHYAVLFDPRYNTLDEMEIVTHDIQPR